MAFKRVKGSDRGMIKRAISATAFNVGDYLDYDPVNAICIAGTASSEMDNRAGIVVAATTTADTEVLLQRPITGDLYLVDTINNTNVAHNYQRMIWGTGHKANNTGTDVPGDTGILRQINPVGATTDKLILAELTFTPGD